MKHTKIQTEFDRVLLKHGKEWEPNVAVCVCVGGGDQRKTNIRSVRGNILKFHPLDSLDIWLALFLLCHLESQRFSSILEEHEWHQLFVSSLFVLRAVNVGQNSFYSTFSIRSPIFCFVWKLQSLRPLKPNRVSLYLQWKPAVCFRKDFSFAYVLCLAGETSPLYVTVSAIAVFTLQLLFFPT